MSRRQVDTEKAAVAAAAGTTPAALEQVVADAAAVEPVTEAERERILLHAHIARIQTERDDAHAAASDAAKELIRLDAELSAERTSHSKTRDQLRQAATERDLLQARLDELQPRNRCSFAACRNEVANEGDVCGAVHQQPRRKQ